jgi:GNAT superfamily N-acetyltransferase
MSIAQAHSPEYYFNREQVSNVKHEMMPLLKDHFKEISLNQDIPLDPNFEHYENLENQGFYQLFVARDGKGSMIGYAAFIVSYNLHYSSSLQAHQDVIFLNKEFRNTGLGKSLILFCDEQLKEDGVQVVYHHTKVKQSFGPLLEGIGYKRSEYIYSKRLDKE